MTILQFKAFMRQIYMEQIDSRKQRFAKIRMGLKTNPAIQATRAKLDEKIQKKTRKSSIQYGDFVTIDLDGIESEQEDTNSSLFHQKYSLGDKAGQGAHGVVKQCINKNTGEVLAVKTSILEREQILHLKKNFTEIKSLSHPNILIYKSIYFELKNARCYLVMDYFPHPELIDIMIDSEEELRDIAHQLLGTIKYLHKKKICHRDIKPENILYNQKNRQIKLIDFGISKKVEERGRKREMLTLTGTPYYRAPEMFSGGGYDHMVDLWAVGVTLFKLMTGFTPFESEYHSQTIDRILKDEVVFPEKLRFECSMTLKRFVKGLLCKHKMERPTAEQALQDMWFLDFRPRDEITKSMNIFSSAYQNNLHNSEEKQGLHTSDGTNKQVGQSKTDLAKGFLLAIEQTNEVFGYDGDLCS